MEVFSKPVAHVVKKINSDRTLICHVEQMLMEFKLKYNKDGLK